MNEAIRKSGATVVAHEYTRQYLSRAGLKGGLPSKTFYTSETLTFGGDTVAVGAALLPLERLIHAEEPEAS